MAITIKQVFRLSRPDQMVWAIVFWVAVAMGGDWPINRWHAVESQSDQPVNEETPRLALMA
jgi:hypothetical protein